MKKINIYLFLTFFLGMVVFTACREERDYPELTLGSSTAPVVTMTLVEAQLHEFDATVEVTSNMNGNIYVLSLPQGSEAPAAQDIVSDGGSIAAEATANEAQMVLVGGLESGSSYDVYAVATNAEEGKPGAVVGPVAVNTPDQTGPYIVESIPAHEEEWVDNNLSQIVLTFSENVTLVNANMISIVDAFDESDLGVKGTVTVEGSVVTIEVTDQIPYLTVVAVLIDSGAFRDVANINSPAYYITDGAYDLAFAIEDFINIDNFIGAYRCYEVGADYYEDVLLMQSDDYAVDVINMIDYGVVATIVFEEDSCYFPDQPSGLSAGGTPLNFVSTLIPGQLTYEPGTYAADGSSIKINYWLYDPVAGDIYLADDLEFEKYTSTDKAYPQANPERLAKELKPLKKWHK